MITLRVLFRVTQTPSRHLPDTFQTPSNLFQISSTNALHNAKVNRVAVVWKVSERCVEGGWRLLGWLWPHPGGLSYQINWQKSIEGTLSIVLIGLFLFSQWPWIGHRMPYFGVSVRCLEDVWEVSGVVWVTLDIVWGGVGVGEGYDVKLIDTNLIWVILISWFLLSQVPQNAWRLSGKCLRGVWGLCEWLWILSGGVWCAGNW